MKNNIIVSMLYINNNNKFFIKNRFYYYIKFCLFIKYSFIEIMINYIQI